MRLIEPAADYCRQIREYKDAFLECGDSMDGTSDLRPFDMMLNSISVDSSFADNNTDGGARAGR